jgi:hypothetical protein
MDRLLKSIDGLMQATAPGRFEIAACLTQCSRWHQGGAEEVRKDENPALSLRDDAAFATAKGPYAS